MHRHLQVLLGRQRGRVETLAPGTYVIGRSSDCDLVLVSELVSRRHAELVVEPRSVRVTDLGSSNGTFVNGARVLGEGAVAEGDVLLVGEVALRLHGATVPALLDGSEYATRRHASDGAALPLSGLLTEVPAAVLLRHLAVAKKSGVLELTSPPLRGLVTFARGHISDVSVDGRPTRDPVQALTSILRWRGTFELGAPAAPDTSSRLLGLDVVLPAVGSASRASRPPRPRA